MYTLYLRLLLPALFLLAFSVQAQILEKPIVNDAGFTQTKISAQKIDPVDQLKGNVTTGVSTFTGQFTSSYLLGSIATPHDLKFDLYTSYAGQFNAGNDYDPTSGIPYGSGWNLQVPSITVSLTSWDAVPPSLECNFSPYDNTDHYKDRNPSNHNAVNWFAPTLSIPGVCSGVAVFKYLDNSNAMVFVLKEFDQYIEAKFYGDHWEVYLPNGTRYEFYEAQIGYNEGTNVRHKSYNTLLKEIGSGNYFSQDQVNYLPQRTVNKWYCSGISNLNYPRENISFNYDHHGCFNFFKELDQENLVIYGMPFFSGSPRNTIGYSNFEACTEIFLKSVEARIATSYVGAIELEYGSHYSATAFPDPLMDYTRPGISRYDSVYSYRTVYNSNNIEAGNWARFLHAMAPAKGSLKTAVTSATNPYLTGPENATIYTYQSAGKDLTFRHGFLESADIPNVYPGALYELRSTVLSSTKALSYIDFNVFATVRGSIGITDVSQGTSNATDYYNKRKRSVFSTFQRGIKWNTYGHNIIKDGGTNHVSTFFRIPSLPDEFNALRIQIGPANSDNNFAITPALGFDPGGSVLRTPSIPRESAMLSYWFCQKNLSGNATPPFAQTPMPNNFGIGLPWAGVMQLHEKTSAFPIDHSNYLADAYFKFWWNDGSGTGNVTYPNVPSRMGEEHNMKDVQLLVYAKNPYMLKAVKTYIKNGDYQRGGKVLVKHVALEYVDSSAFVLAGDIYTINYTGRSSSRQYVSFLLSKISDIPLEGTAKPQFTRFTYRRVPQNTFNVANQNFYFSAIPFLVTSVTNELGARTFIEYNSLFSDSCFVIPRNVTVGSACPERPLATPGSVDIIPTVKNLITESRNGKLYQSYKYENRRYKGYSLTLPQKYSISQTSSQVGFEKVTVYSPGLNTGDSALGRRPRTVYTHYIETVPLSATDQRTLVTPAFGKTKTIEKYDPDNFLFEKKEYFYTALAAFNGKADPGDVNMKKMPRDFEYMHCYSETSNLFIGRAVTYGGAFGPIFLGAEPASGKPYNALNNTSYFIRLDKEVTTAYDKNGTVSYNISGTALPGSANAGGTGIVNTAVNTGALLLKPLAAVIPMLPATRNMLIDASPLQDDIIRTLITFQALNSTMLSEILLQQQALSEAALALLVQDNRYPSAFRTAILLRQPYLTDQTLILALKPASAMSSADLVRLLARSENHYESVLTAVLNSSMDPQDISTVMRAQTAYSQAVQSELIAKYRPETEFMFTEILSANKWLSTATQSAIIDLIPRLSVKNLAEILQDQQTVLLPEQADRLVSRITAEQLPDLQALLTRLDIKLGTEAVNTIVGIGGQVTQGTLSGPVTTVLTAAPCTGIPVKGTVALQTITEYNYYDCDTAGRTASPAFKKLFDYSGDTIYLKHLPSWNLFSKKTYSPQLPDRFTQEEHYYIYDLANYFDRKSMSYYSDRYGEIDNLYDCLEEYPIAKDYPFNRSMRERNLNNPVLYFTLERYNRNMEYEIRNVSRLGSGPIVKRSKYFNYNVGWELPEEEHPISQIVDHSASETCPTTRPRPPYRPNPYDKHRDFAPFNEQFDPLFSDTRCEEKKFPFNFDFSTYDFDPDYDYFIRKDYEKERPTGILTVKICPYGAYDTLATEYFFLKASTRRVASNSSGNLAAVDSYARRVIWLEEEAVKIDTVYISTYDFYKNITVNNNDNDPLMTFDTYIENGLGKVRPVYPYGTVVTRKVFIRNRFGLPLLEEVNGTKIRYNYKRNYLIWNRWPNGPCENYNAELDSAIGLPVSVTYNDGEPDAVTINYEYDRRNNLSKVTDYNGSITQYGYDHYNRPNKITEDGKVLSESEFGLLSMLDNPPSGYLNQPRYNFIQHKSFNSATTGSVTRKFFEANGSVYNALSAELSPYTTGKNLRISSGYTEYDRWNRITKNYKPFYTSTATAQSVEFPSVPMGNNQVVEQTAYENGGWNRPVKSAKYGVNLTTGRTVNYGYTLMKGAAFLCELNISTAEIAAIVPGLNNNMVFLRTQTTDEDGKNVFSYQNALGQQIATRQLDGTKQVITLFGYDSYGNQNLVINPLKQQTKTWFNMQGLPYQVQNPDGGVKKLMYDIYGRVVLEQDARLMAGFTDPVNGLRVMHYKQNRYDKMGRLIEERHISPEIYKTGSLNKATLTTAPSDAMPYRNLGPGDLQPTGNCPVPSNAGYTFTNSSTYYELARFNYPRVQPNSSGAAEPVCLDIAPLKTD
ncbi:MAG: RHS repeat domain-containing protein, partial [Bacteroidota bacterium]